SSGRAPDAGKPSQSRPGAEIGQGRKRGWFVEMCERRIELRPERQWVKHLSDAAYRLGLATCFLRAVDDPQGPGQAVLNAPVPGKIGKRRSQRGDGLIGTVVVLEVPSPNLPAIVRDRAESYAWFMIGCHESR